MSRDKTPSKIRADLLLLQKGLVSSRERARALILAGKVFSGQNRIAKAGQQLSIDTSLILREADHPYVSRGGVKLQGAFEEFGVDVTHAVVADFGASTGGFTDCLLQRGARKVYAIDVGYGQLHEKLRTHERVVVMDRTNARYLQSSDFPESVDFVVIDTSFIGIAKLLPSALSILKAEGQIIAMVKPQFELNRSLVGKGGVVKSEQARTLAIQTVRQTADALGLIVLGGCDSVIKGPKGNLEHFLWLRKTQSTVA